MSNEDDPKPTVMEQRKALLESGEFQRMVMKELLTPEAMASIREFQNSPVMQQIRDFQNSPLMQVLKGFQRMPVVENFRTVMEQFKSSVLPPEVVGTIRAVRALGIALNDIERSPLFQHLVSGQGSALGTMAPLSGHAVGSAVATADMKVITAKEIEIERQIVEHLESGHAVGTLSETQKARLWSVMQLLQMIVIWLATQNAVREELCFFQPKLVPTLSTAQVGKAVRNFMCERDAPLEILRNYRTVKGTGVRLRVDPSMKAEQVQVTLEDRALLEVLDGSNRDWLHVSVIGEDGLEGWISRKYTHRLLQ